MSKLTIAESHGHGKACKGVKKTSSVQVRLIFNDESYTVEKIFRYTVGDGASRDKAFKKARDYVKLRGG